MSSSGPGLSERAAHLTDGPGYRGPDRFGYEREYRRLRTLGMLRNKLDGTLNTIKTS